MTVQDLINQLQKLPPDAIVIIRDIDNDPVSASAVLSDSHVDVWDCDTKRFYRVHTVEVV